jgi:hypothetical protein
MDIVLNSQKRTWRRAFEREAPTEDERGAAELMHVLEREPGERRRSDCPPTWAA